MQTFFQDLLRYSRLLGKNPGFLLAIVFILALGIGLNTTVFSIVHGILLTPPPYRDPSNLVTIWESFPKLGEPQSSVSAGEFLDYRNRNRSFSQLAGFENDNYNLTGEGQPYRVTGALVSGNMFPLLGVNVELGRGLNQDDDRLENIVVLSHRLWMSRFHGDRSVIGTTIHLDEKPFVVVGVAPAGFQFPWAGLPLSEPAELWIPLVITPSQIQDRVAEFPISLVARLKSGVSVEQARADVSQIARDFAREHSDIYSGNLELSTILTPFQAEAVSKVRPVLLVLWGAVGFVFLICCSNAANLLLMRAISREKEFAIRSALGANYRRLIRQLLTENLALSVLSGVLGVLLSYYAIHLVRLFGPKDLPHLESISVDTTALFFGLGISLLAGLLFGLAPVLSLSIKDLSSSLHGSVGRASAGKPQRRWRSFLIVFETAIALVLLTSSYLLIDSFIHILRVPPGFNPDHVLVARTYFDQHRYPQVTARWAAQKAVLERLGHLPGVQIVGAATHLPLADDRMIGFRLEGESGNEVHLAYNTMISPDYLQAMGISLLRGRTFTLHDAPDTPMATMVNETLARRYWPGQDPIGKKILWGTDSMNVIGMVSDVKVSGLDVETTPTIYTSIFQIEGSVSSQIAFAIRTTGDAGMLAPAVSREIWAVDKDLPIFGVSTMDQVVSESLASKRFSMVLLTFFGGFALLLAAAGVYGVIGHSIATRMKEFGIRLALGAKRSHVILHALREAMVLVGIGLLIGVIATIALAPVLKHQLFEFNLIGPEAFVISVLTLALVGFCAAIIPVLRAANADPLKALHQE